MRKITLTENQLKCILKETVKNILNEGIFEKKSENKKEDEDKEGWKKNDSSRKGVDSQARQALADDKWDMAEIARELEDEGYLSGDEDTDRSWISKISRGERPLPKGVAAAVVNITSGDK